MIDNEKRYNEALEQAKKELAACGSMDCDAARLIFRLFPQLRESEDERIRKELLEFLDCSIFCDELDEKKLASWIAWLEKQKEPRYTKEEVLEELRTDLCNNDIYRVPEWLREVLLMAKENGKKEAEQKPAEKMGFHKCKTGEVVTEWKKEDIDDKMLSKSKPSWSEEDEKKRQRIINLLEQANKNWRIAQNSVPFGDLINWLKSLRPQPDKCDGCSKHLEGYIDGRADAENKLLDQFGILIMPEGELHMKPRWKPSEEQMEALRRAVNKLANTDVADSVRLSIMYDNLKRN